MRLPAIVALLLLARPALAEPAEPSPTPSPVATADPLLPPESPVDPRLERSDAVHRTADTFLLTAPPVARPRLSTLQVASLIAMPAGCLLIGGATYAGLAAQTGDAGTPAVEMGAAYAGAWAVTGAFGLGLYTVDREAFTPAPVRGGFKDATGAIGASLVLVPLAAGASTYFAGESLEGRSRHPLQSLAGATAGATAGEIFTAGSTLLFHTPAANGPVAFAYLPLAAGSTLGYRLARGHFDRPSALIRSPIMISLQF